VDTMITWTKRLIITASFLALITTNILTLTSTAFNAAISGLMGTALGIRTVSSMMHSKLASQGKEAGGDYQAFCPGDHGIHIGCPRYQ
jgi:hypothetical protein